MYELASKVGPLAFRPRSQDVIVENLSKSEEQADIDTKTNGTPNEDQSASAAEPKTVDGTRPAAS